MPAWLGDVTLMRRQLLQGTAAARPGVCLVASRLRTCRCSTQIPSPQSVTGTLMWSVSSFTHARYAQPACHTPACLTDLTPLACTDSPLLGCAASSSWNIPACSNDCSTLPACNVNLGPVTRTFHTPVWKRLTLQACCNHVSTCWAC